MNTSMNTSTPTTTPAARQVLALLRQRNTPLWRLPFPPPVDDETDMAERHSFGGEDLARMTLRMGRALRRLGLAPGDALALHPTDSLEHLMLILAALLHGHALHLLPTPQGVEEQRNAAQQATTCPPSTTPLPKGSTLLICPPAWRDHYRSVAAEAGIRLATLGGHWQGSFFMLQMVQQVEENAMPPIPSGSGGKTADTAGGHITFPDGTSHSLAEALQQAENLARTHALAHAPALLLSMPFWQNPRYLAAILAALLHAGNTPVFWLPPAERSSALQALPDTLPANTWLLGDAAFITSASATTGAATRLQGGQRIRIDAP